MAEDGYKVATVQGREVQWDPEQMRKIQEHPCFSEKACHSFGRMHLPVAPRCNIQCNYCVRDYDCVNESRPGVTSRVLTPDEAVAMIKKVMAQYNYIKVIGIAGPGEPLANEETFETLRLVHEFFPSTIRCISTNGLLLPEKIDLLEKYGVGNVTVTLNALDPEVGAKIYSFINYHGNRYEGVEGAKILLENQLKGIELAVKKHMIVKINTVYIPGVNDDQILEIARKTSAMGAYTFNLIPLIAQYKFADIVPPTPAEKRAMQDQCAPYIKQMRHCQRCRADAIGKIGHDVQSCVYGDEGTKKD
ncbi:nitrogenase cofactor biosynthesis protein NifB [Methanosphaerula palustris]|uniref:FeMo cofactor biosynthesis protein NifB n=1 Tax=Methanosphaerula palustris (strain ATCC BAA-1556 / DSM 19958 / E1-9c) TaxID=521011 RepID=B8GJM8_METPE|nr:nitrogenase cofactor biosynthesis protein NifB [Methanosphaerula palustris]ACL15682.1 Radical SAM domain protein [Methanosphaerula palustris E1-9c]